MASDDGRRWDRIPGPIRLILYLVLFVPSMVFLNVIVEVVADGLAGGSAGSGMKFAVSALFFVGVLIWLRRWVNRSHGGAKGRRAFQESLRTGIISPDADRRHLEEVVDLHSQRQSRATLVTVYTVFALLGALAVLPTVLFPPRSWSEAVAVLPPPVIVLLVLTSFFILTKRRYRQIAKLKRTLDETRDVGTD